MVTRFAPWRNDAAWCALVVVTAALGVVPAGAEEGSASTQLLAKARSLYEALDYEGALRAAERAAAHPDNTRPEMAIAALWEGLLSAELHQTQRAQREFRRALTLDRRARLPVMVSPRVKALFDQALAEVTELDVPKADTASAPALRLNAAVWALGDALGRSVGLVAGLTAGAGPVGAHLRVRAGLHLGLDLGLDVGLWHAGPLELRAGARGVWFTGVGLGGGPAIKVRWALAPGLAASAELAGELYSAAAPYRALALLGTVGLELKLLGR